MWIECRLSLLQLVIVSREASSVCLFLLSTSSSIVCLAVRLALC